MATPRQWRRRRRFSLFALTVAAALVVAAVAFGAVHTDQYYYNAGDTVQITGDNMAANEAVTVDVTYPDATLAQEHVVAADESGNFADSYTIQDTDPTGVYTVTATGQESGSVFTTTFDPAPAGTTTSLNLPANVTYGDPFTFSGTVTYSGGNVGSTGQVEVQENLNHDPSCGASEHFASAGDLGTDTSLSSGGYSVGPLDPATFAWPSTGNISGFTTGYYYVKLGLSVGTYGFNAHYSGGTPTYAASDSTCKEMTVQKANTSVTGSAPASIPENGTFDIGWTVSSTQGVTGNTATGNVTISEASKPGGASFNCTPSSRSVSAAQQTTAPNKGFSQSGSGGSGSTGFTCSPDTVGDYTFKVHFVDTDGNYNNNDSSEVTVSVLPESSFTAVTSKGLCTLNAGAENQFRLIYTPDQSLPGDYKLSASNPGQFSYNVAYSGSGDEDVALPSSLTGWFVTQGAMPVKIYDGGSVADGCIQPGNLIASETLTADEKVHVPSLSGDFALITVHIDYKWKGEYQCVHGGSDTATCSEPDAATITSPQSYTGLGVTSVNVFKNDPGIGGLVTQASDGTPVAGATVQIYDAKNKLLATVTTDQDGWYMWNYKYTGKPATFTVKLVDTGESTSVTLKANGFLVVNFTE